MRKFFELVLVVFWPPLLRPTAVQYGKPHNAAVAEHNGIIGRFPECGAGCKESTIRRRIGCAPPRSRIWTEPSLRS